MPVTISIPQCFTPRKTSRRSAIAFRRSDLRKRASWSRRSPLTQRRLPETDRCYVLYFCNTCPKEEPGQCSGSKITTRNPSSTSTSSPSLSVQRRKPRWSRTYLSSSMDAGFAWPLGPRYCKRPQELTNASQPSALVKFRVSASPVESALSSWMARNASKRPAAMPLSVG
jgi:hypothetical protein